MTPTVAVNPPRTGRRERKKQRTREALIDAAFTLFQDKGFEATTVEEIADAVDVSSRTFFRYFASKEDVVLNFLEDQRRVMMELLAARPADEPIVTALRRAAVSVAQACESGDSDLDPERFGCIQDLLISSPTLHASSIEHSQQKQLDLARLIAERMGVDLATDLRPYVVASAALCIFHTAADTQQAVPTLCSSFSDYLDHAFGLLEEGLNYPTALSQRGAGSID